MSDVNGQARCKWTECTNVGYCVDSRDNEFFEEATKWEQSERRFLMDKDVYASWGSWNEKALAYKICDGSGEDPDCFGTDYWPSRVDHTLFDDHTSYFAINQDGLCGEDVIDDEVELSHDVDDNEQDMDNDFESWPNDWVNQVTKRLAMDG